MFPEDHDPCFYGGGGGGGGVDEVQPEGHE